MNLTKFSIEKNRVVLSILGVIVIAGLIMYLSLPRDSMPPYTIRVASVVTIFPGASPERVEELVTDKIEKVAQELPELKLVKSNSRTGLSVVKVELRMEIKPGELQPVWDRLRRKLNSIKGLPENVRPTLKDEGLGEVFGIAVGMTSDGFTYAEMKDYADDLRNALIKLPDAAKVEINGEQEERVFIEFDNTRLKNYGLTAGRLQALIGTTNILNSGGDISVEEERIILEPTGNFDSIEAIKKMLIPIGKAGQVVPLEDITVVKQGYIDPPKQVVKINGLPAFSLHVSLKKGANIIKLGEDIDQVIEKLYGKLPVGLEAFRVSSLDDYISSKISNFVDNLIQAIVIVLVVMLIFLGFRTGLVIASLIPFVTITTLFMMGLMGIGLNQITLAALIMALGMMVDNGIVVAESIMVKVEQGIDIKKAAIDACSELFVPLLISTLTTSAAFLSFYLAESVMGDLMGPLFVVISIALLSSWVLSLSIITLLSVFFLKVKTGDRQRKSVLDRIIGTLKRYYKNLILQALAWKRLVMVVIVGLFVLSLVGFRFLGFLFFPDSDRNMITVDVNLPEGTQIEATTKVVAGIEKYLQEKLKVNKTRTEGVVSWASFIGKGPSSYDLGYNADEANSNYAHLLVNTSSFEINGELISKLDVFCFDSFPNADIKIARLGAAGGGAPIEIKVSGDDPDKLSEISNAIKTELNRIKGTKNIKDDWGPKGKKFIVEIDQNKAQNARVSNQDIAVSLQTVLNGFKAGEYRKEDKSIPIVMKGIDSKEQTLNKLMSLNIYSQSSGKSVPFLQVARLVPQWQYAKIKRLDLVRTVVISSQLSEDGNASKVIASLTPWLLAESKKWGDGYSYKLGGDSERTAENMGAVAKYLPLAGFIIVMLLIIQFNSFRKMAMIVCTIPLGVIGMVIGLFVFGTPFGFMAFLGMISLAGIVINNAIVLVDRIEIEENELKRSPQDAVIAACLQRFRPILLATFTTVLGLIPLYLGGGATWEPMAVTIMVGLLFGTVITLLFIPSLYSILYKVKYEGYVFDEKLME
ncbi:MAG TPA: AcrB/AcrD/AcrF family protein [Microscillaceae bacterium]|nr:AcrB/AcrD/AcrF family protein [Microscillaceae bacterium]